MTEGCLHGEDTYFCRGIERCSNVIYTKQLKIFFEKKLVSFIERMSSSQNQNYELTVKVIHYFKAEFGK